MLIKVYKLSVVASSGLYFAKSARKWYKRYSNMAIRLLKSISTSFKYSRSSLTVKVFPFISKKRCALNSSRSEPAFFLSVSNSMNFWHHPKISSLSISFSSSQYTFMNNWHCSA
eukprot:Lithocolla_globosa_v1_NODE_5911_length_1164_cov_518.740307.p2 type:complete len:114 gc:universal NODE_5911_length_1164_cov_518.740307:504-163(-)